MLSHKRSEDFDFSSNKKLKRESESIGQSFERQLNFPSPILAKIICNLDYLDLLSALMSCKQIYFLSKTEQFWRSLVMEKSEHKEENLPRSFEEKSWKELFFCLLNGWDTNISRQYLQFSANTVKHLAKQSTLVFTKKKFLTGMTNVLFTFLMDTSKESISCEVGICLDKR